MNQTQEHSEMIHKILSGTRWAAFLRAGGQVFSWLGSLLVVRFISPDDYGLNSMLETPFVLMMLLSTLGLDVALVQSRKLERVELRSVFGWLLIINALLFLTYFFGGALLAAHFNEPRLEILAKVLAFLFLLAPFRVIPNALLDRELNFKLRAKVELMTTVISTLLTLTLAILGAGVWALVFGVLVNRVLQAVLLMALQPWFVLPALDYATAHRLMAFGGITTVTSMAAMLSGKAVILIAGPKLGAELLGIYTVSMELAMLPLAKAMPIIHQTLLPTFSKFQSQRNLAAYYMEKMLGIVALAMLPAMIGMSCVADQFVSAILGMQWSDTARPLALLSVMMIFRAITQLIQPVMTSMGCANLSLTSSLLILILVVPASLFGIQYGVVGLAIVWLITEGLVMLVTVQMSRWALDTSLVRIIRSLFPALAASAAMVVSVLGVRWLLGHIDEFAIWSIAEEISVVESLRSILRQGSSFTELMTSICVGAFTYWLVLRLFFAATLKYALTLVLGRGGSSALSQTT